MMRSGIDERTGRCSVGRLPRSRRLVNPVLIDWKDSGNVILGHQLPCSIPSADLLWHTEDR